MEAMISSALYLLQQQEDFGRAFWAGLALNVIFTVVTLLAAVIIYLRQQKDTQNQKYEDINRKFEAVVNKLEIVSSVLADINKQINMIDRSVNHTQKYLIETQTSMLFGLTGIEKRPLDTQANVSMSLTKVTLPNIPQSKETSTNMQPEIPSDKE